MRALFLVMSHWYQFSVFGYFLLGWIQISGRMQFALTVASLFSFMQNILFSDLFVLFFELGGEVI